MPLKALTLDLDDTLWGGVVGDVGWEGLRLGGHINKGLQAEWNRYGEAAFVFDVVEMIDDELPEMVVMDTLKVLKKKWMEELGAGSI